jgi:hypothetical protein
MDGDIRTDGSNVKAAAPKVFSCPSCGASIALRALGQTISVACSACGSIIDATNSDYQILSKAAKALRIQPVIPLGTRGRLKGVLWEVIGFMERCDQSGLYKWGEYLLFNPSSASLTPFG